ncbi:helix-turn-helix domain-containing protein [Pectobacterium punjabense]|nr:helix-turn-helix domain-containing protein [Pectobacterium punjabense]MDG0797472.1 helix-turn-helix domain-containing protein [Pectobacterium punjabense]
MNEQGRYPTDVIAVLKKRGTLLAAVSRKAD